MNFLIDTGEWQQIKFRDTVSRDQAIAAIRHWMVTGSNFRPWIGVGPRATPAESRRTP